MNVLGWRYKIIIDNGGYTDVRISEHEVKPYLHLCCIHINNNPEIFTEDIPLKICLYLANNSQEPYTSENYDLHIAQCKIYIPEDGVTVCKNSAASRDIIGEISSNMLVILKTQSNVLGVNITFDPPQISSSHSKSSIIIKVDKNAIPDKYNITVIGEFKKNESVTCNLGITINKLNIKVKIFNDKNANGIEDLDEDGLSNWTISLIRNENNDIRKTITAKDGSFIFQNIEPGAYKLEETIQPRWEATVPVNASYTLLRTSTIS